MRDQNKSQLTTHCYLEKDGKYLMLHRISKKNDVNKDKWIGVGGHFEEGESPEECVRREVLEETGYTLLSCKFHGIVTFTQEGYGTEYMCLYTSDNFCGTQKECDEGKLEWIPKEKLCELPMWEGDQIFNKLIAQDAPFFSLKLTYKGDLLAEVILDGKKLIPPYIIEKS